MPEPPVEKPQSPLPDDWFLEEPPPATPPVAATAPTPVSPRIPENNTTKILGIVSIFLGSIGLLFCPIIIAGAGLTCGIVGLVRKDDQPKTLPLIGTIISAISIPLGSILSMLVNA